MDTVIDMEGVRSGTAHLNRARELGKQRGVRMARPVPIDEIVAGGNIFTVEELSAMVRLAPITILRAIRAGELRAANGGGKSGYRITRGDISAWWRGRGGGDLFAADNDQEQTAKGNPLAAALAMVQARDAATPPRPMRTAGVDDAASDIRAMREEQTP
jgi:excisionase family DNA binding protein